MGFPIREGEARSDENNPRDASAPARAPKKPSPICGSIVTLHHHHRTESFVAFDLEPGHEELLLTVVMPAGIRQEKPILSRNCRFSTTRTHIFESIRDMPVADRFLFL